MKRDDTLKLALEDVLGELWHARRTTDLGKLALLVHLDLRRWAAAAGNVLLAQQARELVLSCPQGSRQEFLDKVDALIREAERAHEQGSAVAL